VKAFLYPLLKIQAFTYLVLIIQGVIIQAFPYPVLKIQAFTYPILIIQGVVFQGVIFTVVDSSYCNLRRIHQGMLRHRTISLLDKVYNLFQN